MNCLECESNDKCKKPYECEKVYQEMYLGRIYTKDQWIEEGQCSFFKPIDKLLNKGGKK